ncbi:SMC family ATPase [Paeniglutamicibacter antarcticus]|uniref:Nuclease SbcCD subunit C n=1 Tax=Arthrobacter terrae TaxID=2935737 RepID=A0A931CV28_9MICC|nr:SMC family ATPase [Arthrobacter terrae]MBG0741489.1 SMC family ATPase [Arthrobacter terrae]
MRIHKLEIQAFGPFAGRQAIDFDALGEQGLFLLNGATGAGKTSILDAICYALYGSVPGSRQSGKRLRSDHADQGTEPQVVCEFSARGRRLEVLRSPAWERPAKRGKGTTLQQAKTQLRERENGEWVEKSTRNDEAGAEIVALLGMDKDQFTKVVLLAQGDFAAFLRSKAEERQELLQKLFGTQLYKRVERQLAADAATAKSALTEKEQELLRLEALAQSQAAGIIDLTGGSADSRELSASGASGAGGHAVVGEAAGGLLFARLLEMIGTAHAAAESAALISRSDEQAAADALLQADRLRDRHGRLRQAETERTRLAAAAPDYALWQGKVLAHREAEVLAGQLAAMDRAASLLGDADESAGRELAQLEADASACALAGLDVVPGPIALSGSVTDGADADGSGPDGAGADGSGPDGSALAAAQKRLERQIIVVEESLPDEERLVAQQAELLAAEAGAHEATAAAAEHARISAGASVRHNQLREGLANLLESARAAAEHQRAVDSGTEVLATIRAHQGAAALATACEQEYQKAQLVFLQAKEHWLEQRDRRLELAAGELAAKLEAGQPCLVCGSAEHPHPSELSATGQQRVEEEKLAKAGSDRAETAAVTAARKLAQARQEAAVLAAKGGTLDVAETEEKVAAARGALAEAAAAAAVLLRHEQELELLGVRIKEEDVLAASAREKAAGLVASKTAGAENVQRLDSRLAASRGGFASLADRLTELRRAALLLSRAVTAVQARNTAAKAAADAREALELALPTTRFMDVPSVRVALLTSADATVLRELIRGHDEDLVRCAASFAAADIQAAAAEAERGLTIPDDERLEQLGVDARAATDAVHEAALRRELAATALAAVRTAAQKHAALDASVRPLRDHAIRVAGIADAVRGLGENAYKMPLNSFVLAARLEQVAVAASERLLTMSDGRYTLSYSDALAGGNQKSGLGLQAVDEWTGQRRDTATLSGGESFMASLALALGLADVVQQEAGGVDIETLFVDEGFGSLDEQSLEQVMDALEGLRSGGRVVGLVSHVAEMKLRIPSQLHVHKGRTGSTLSVTETAGQ